MNLAIQPGQVFKIAEIAYREGVIDKALPITGEAMKIARDKAGIGVVELMEGMNEAEDASVERVDKLLQYSGPMLSLLGKEALMGPLMRLVSRMLDFAAVQRAAVWTMARVMVVVFNVQLKINAKKLAALGVK